MDHECVHGVHTPVDKHLVVYLILPMNFIDTISALRPRYAYEAAGGAARSQEPAGSFMHMHAACMPAGMPICMHEIRTLHRSIIDAIDRYRICMRSYIYVS